MLIDLISISMRIIGIVYREILQMHIPQNTVWAFGSRVKGTAKT